MTKDQIEQLLDKFEAATIGTEWGTGQVQAGVEKDRLRAQLVAQLSTGEQAYQLLEALMADDQNQDLWGEEWEDLQEARRTLRSVEWV